MDRVLVWGMAKSGVAAAGLLAKAGKHVIINDLKTASQLGDSLAPLNGLAIEERLGEDPQGLLESIDTLVISPGIPADHPVAVKAREMGIEVISEIELAYRFSKGLLVGVTGTNGKTTTTTLLGEIFSAWGRRTFVVGNIGEPYAAHAQETDEGSVTVCELSSFQLETVSSLRPDISLILNLTEDHLNRHKTMENYARIKERVFMNQTGGDVCVLNYDDPITRGMASRANCRVLFFSRREKISEGAYVDNGSVVFASNGSEETVIKTEEILLPGTHNLENALAAVCAAMAAGVDKQVISDTLRHSGTNWEPSFPQPLPTNPLQWLSITACTNTEFIPGKKMFPPNIKSEPDGNWSTIFPPLCLTPIPLASSAAAIISKSLPTS